MGSSSSSSPAFIIILSCPDGGMEHLYHKAGVARRAAASSSGIAVCHHHHRLSSSCARFRTFAVHSFAVLPCCTCCRTVPYLLPYACRLPPPPPFVRHRAVRTCRRSRSRCMPFAIGSYITSSSSFAVFAASRTGQTTDNQLGLLLPYHHTLGQVRPGQPGQTTDVHT